MQVLFMFWLSLLPLLHPSPTVSAAAPNPCRIYGSVYLEREPMYKSTASHTVFIGEEEAFADMVVFRESNKLFADATAIWYITPNKAFADHILYVTDQRHLADFTVHFTDVRAVATCRD